MLDGCQHRGPDSTGFALYGQAIDGQLRLRFLGGTGAQAQQAIERLHQALREHDAALLATEHIGNNYRAPVRFNGDLRQFAYALERNAKVMSIGSSLEIVKDVGNAHNVDHRYPVSSFLGTQGLGHVRLATEPEVKSEASHPFWATGFGDVAIVHNGHITNYCTLRTTGKYAAAWSNAVSSSPPTRQRVHRGLLNRQARARDQAQGGTAYLDR